MKKYLLYITSAIICLLSANACKSELENLDEGTEPVLENSIHLSIETGSPEMKTYIEGTSPKWYNGDKLGVFFDSWSAGATAVNATLSNSEADGEKAIFEGDVAVDEGSHTVSAFYPARAFYATEAGSIVNMEIPYIQFPTATSFDPKADLLVSVPKRVDISGTSASLENVQFRRVGAIIKVCLTDATTGTVLSSEKVKSVKIESSVFDLAGAFRYDFANEDAAATQILAASAKKYVTADFSESPVAFGSNIYLIANPVTLTSGSTLTFTVLTEGHEVVKVVNLASNVELESSKIATFNLTLNDSCTVTHVYFQDNFDWVYKYWDVVYNNAYGKNQVGLDPVAAGSQDEQPNIWSTYSTSFGAAFTALGYIDLEHAAGQGRNVLYAQENYLKMCKGSNQTGLELPALALGEIPVNVTLKFNLALHDKKDIVVEVTGRGTCADSGDAVGNNITNTSTFSWETKEITLRGLTNSSRIRIRPAVASSSYANSGYYRFWVDNIKVTEADVTATSFPVVWSMPAASNVEGTDYALNNISGSYVYSDTHEGKLSVIRTSTSEATASNTSYQKRSTDTEPRWNGKHCLLHYGIYKEDYWLFEVYNVKNPAGTYTIDYCVESSGNGPKYFVLEYSTDGSSWTTIDGQAGSYATASEEFTYTYSIDAASTVYTINKSFALPALDDFTTLQIRAKVVSKSRVAGTNMAVNHGATNRVGDHVTISFTAD